MSARRTRLTVIGSGALARAVVSGLPPGRGYELTVAARRPAAARALARLRAGTRAASTLASALERAGVVLLAVDDRALRPLAAELAPLRASWRGVVVLHAAGGLGTEELAPLSRRGGLAGILHPIVPLSRAGRSPLAGAHARIAGTPRARHAARALARALALTPIPRARRERKGDRELHHAASALATGDVVGLVALAEDALSASGVPRPAARRAVLAAAAATLRRIGDSGPVAALSGPVVRGDAPRLRRHLLALSGIGAPAAEAHRALALALIDLARGSGRIDAATARALSASLRERGSGRSRTV